MSEFVPIEVEIVPDQSFRPIEVDFTPPPYDLGGALPITPKPARSATPKEN